MERKVTKMGGNLITLEGPELKIGDKAPYFTARTADFYQVSLDDYRGQRKVVSVAPSLDTTVCDLQTRRFNQEMTGLKGTVRVISMSMDLPFALKRWSQSETGLAVDLLSDHMDAAFGLAYGVLIKELRLLNRAVFVVDENDIIRHVEIVEENNNHLNYAAAMEAVRRMG
jgi:thioredoxin-dependent peroxiredoxin